MESPKVVLLNGPPGSGKDTVANGMAGGDVVHRAFKTILFHHTSEYYNVSEAAFFELYNNRATKEAPAGLLGGVSPRQALIHVGEDVYKKRYGKDYFARSLVASLGSEKLAIVSDCGFPEEVDTVASALGSDNVLVVHLYREGCTFTNDSRNYVSNTVCREVDVVNDLDEDTLVYRVRQHVWDAWP